jgi:hypothetical protein
MTDDPNSAQAIDSLVDRLLAAERRDPEEKLRGAPTPSAIVEPFMPRFTADGEAVMERMMLAAIEA